jgi:hypothetical protein
MSLTFEPFNIVRKKNPKLMDQRYAILGLDKKVYFVGFDRDKSSRNKPYHTRRTGGDPLTVDVNDPLFEDLKRVECIWKYKFGQCSLLRKRNWKLVRKFSLFQLDTRRYRAVPVKDLQF